MNTIATIIFSSIILVAPTATRPEPGRIVVHNADYATITPWEEVYAIKQGIHIVDSLVWEDGTIEYLVDPTKDYTVTARGPDDPNTPEIDREVATIQLDVSVENQLDWIIYNRIRWEQMLIELMDSEGLNFFDITESMARVRLDMDSIPANAGVGG